MNTRIILLSELLVDPAQYLEQCFESPQPLVIQLPGDRFVSIRPLEEDDLIDELIAENEEFQALLARSAKSARKPFEPRVAKR
jgi:hypothetical protein